MAINAVEWEALTRAEQLLLAAAGEQSPLSFTSFWFNVTQGDSFKPNWHHHYFEYAAQKVINQEAQNIIVNTPPGSTKTEFWSVHLPAYCMVKFPRVRILNTSYSKDLVTENSDRTRSLIKSGEFCQFYPWEIGKDKVDDWTVESKGKRLHQLFSRASGGQITGVRGGFISDNFSGYVMADDWSKPADMLSDVRRNRSNALLSNTLRSRRASSKTPFLMVQQRVHSEDATSFLLTGGMGLTVDLHIKIPALIDQDYIDSLPPGIKERCIKDVCSSEQIGGYWSYWPAKESVQDLVALKESDPYTFASQYQQDPETLDGGIFNADDFRFYGDDEDADYPIPEKFEFRFITADTAQKTNTWNDWTVFAEWGVYDGRIYRLRYKRAKMEAKELRKEFESFVKACHADNSPSNGVLRYARVEDKSSGTGLIQEVKSRLPVPVVPVPRDKDKLTRAMDTAPHHAAGKVLLPYGDAGNYEFVAEVASFTHDDTHKHDDQTDVMMDAIEHAFIDPARKGKPTVIVGRSRRR